MQQDVLLSSSRAFSLSTKTFSLSTSINNSKPTQKKATKCKKYLCTFQALTSESSLSKSSSLESATSFLAYHRFWFISWVHIHNIPILHLLPLQGQKYSSLQVMQWQKWCPKNTLNYAKWGQIPFKVTCTSMKIWSHATF